MLEEKPVSNILRGLVVAIVRKLFYQFDPEKGVWTREGNDLSYCPKCMANDIITPMRELDNGFFCQHCEIFTYKKTYRSKPKNKGFRKINSCGNMFSTYTFIAFQLNETLGSRDCSFITTESVKKEIKSGSIFSYLRESISDFDDSILSLKERKRLTNRLQDIIDADIDDKLCVGGNGVSLLTAYLLELIQEDDYAMRKELTNQINQGEKKRD